MKLSLKTFWCVCADAETIIKAVFSATKEELSDARVEEIANYLPGEIREFWREA